MKRKKTRKEKRDQRAEILCREIRYQLANFGSISDQSIVFQYLYDWMKYANKNKFERPTSWSQISRNTRTR